MRVFARHANQTYKLAEEPNSYGEYIVLDRADDTVTVYSKRYSTFGIGYTVATTPLSADGTSPATVAEPSTAPNTADETAPLVFGLLTLALAGACYAALARSCRD